MEQFELKPFLNYGNPVNFNQLPLYWLVRQQFKSISSFIV